MFLGAFTGQSATVFPNPWREAFLEEILEVMGGFPQAFDEAEESLGLGGIVRVAAQVFEAGDRGGHQAEQLIRGGLRRQG